MSEYIIRARATPAGPTGGACVRASADLQVFSGDERLLRVELRLAGSAVFSVAIALGVEPERARLTLPLEVQEAVLLAGLQQVREGLRLGHLPPDPPQDPYVLTFGSGDIEALALEGRAKRCGYQRLDGREMFCLAASPSDPAVIGKDGLRMVARTSPRICHECHMPDERFLCRRLLNPQVLTLHLGGRVMESAECELRREEVGHPDACRAGLNQCWEIEVRTEPASISSEYRAPRALVEALGYFDSSWRLAFGRSHRIVQLHGPETVTRLVEGCETAEEFENRMSALATVLDDLVVADDLWSAGLTEEQRREMKPLARLERALDGSQLDRERFARAAKAIQTLRDLKAVRNFTQHTRAEMERAFRKANLSFPPRWTENWEAARAMAAQAITLIREEVASLS